MSFIWPTMLWLLVLIPLGVLFYMWLQRRRERMTARYGELGLAQGAQSGQLATRRHLPSAFFLLSLTILIIALARPQMVVSLPRVEGTVILAFDVSGSMAADDLKPTRMTAAKTAAQDFVQHQPVTMQIGVVAFSDSGLSVQSPTNAQADILAAINRLTPERGTSLANGILAALNAIATFQAGQTTHYYSNRTPMPTLTPTPVPAGTYTSAAIVLLTDGENNENPNPLAAAQAAADRGVRIYTVGIGSAAGTTLHINGFDVHTQLDETMLKQIAQITGGNYYNATSAQDLQRIYTDLTPQLVVKPEKTEMTSIFAGLSLIILLVGGAFSLLWFNRLP